MSSPEETEAKGSKVDSSITQAEVTEVVKKLLGRKAPGVDESPSEYLKSLDVVLSLVDTSLQHRMAVGDCTSGLADRGCAPSFQEGGPEGVFQLQRDHTP